MAYVAVSRAREEALIYTDSTQNLRETLNRATNKEMAFEATKSKSSSYQRDRNELTNDPFPPHEQFHNGRDHGMDQNSPQIDPTQTQAVELAVESESQEIAAFLM
jgi:hypothetical protein